MALQDDSDTIFAKVLNVVCDVKKTFNSCFDASVYVKAIEVGCRQQNIKTETDKEHYLRYRGEYVGSYKFHIVANGSVAVLVKNNDENDDAFWQCCQNAKIDGINMNDRDYSKIETQRYNRQDITFRPGSPVDC